MAKNKIILFPPRKTVKPGKDFYTYINGNWIRHASIPSFISSYSVSEEIEDQVSEELQKEVQKAVAAIKNEESITRERELIGTLALSTLQTSYQKESLSFLKTLINKLGCIRDINDVASTLGDFCRYRVDTIISVFSAPESKHSKKIRMCIGSGSIGLPDISYYRATAPGKMRTLLAYIQLLRKLGEEFDVHGLELLASLEAGSINSLIKSMGDDEIILKGVEIKERFKAVPWDIFFEAGFNLTPNMWANKEFIILSTNWLKHINKLFKTLTLAQWKIWLAGNLILHSLPILPPPFDDLHFELFGKRLRGQTEKIPQKNLALLLCQQWLPVQLGKIFEDCCLDKENVRLARKLSTSIQDATIYRINKATWLDPSTRRKAVSKVKHVYFGIGIPEVWPETYEPQLLRDNLLKNILMLGEARTINDLEATKHPLAIRSWDDPAFAVNAYYYNEGNRLLIPGGIIRYPFIDKNKSDGWNYGGLGAAIGHELTHAFDVEGKDYNEKGDALQWWLPEDNRAYNKKTKNIITLFNETTYKGHPINGILTLSENIADLGGLTVALEALHTTIRKKNLSEEEKKQEYIDFFTSYAVSWRIKEKREASLQGLIVDRHAPAPMRVNLVVSQLQEWYDAFDIKENDDLYIQPEKRVTIF
jgi:predicted metalloendopeptidase